MNLTLIFIGNHLKLYCAWEKDLCTQMENLLILPVYDDIPCKTITIPKMDTYNKNAFNVLLNLDGIEPEDLSQIKDSIKKLKARFSKMVHGNNACNIYDALRDYVQRYYRKDEVFIEYVDGVPYGNIKADMLERVLQYLQIRMKPLELERMFKALNLLRTNGGTTKHNYTYKIKRYWYFSFRLDACSNNVLGIEGEAA